MNIKKLNEFFRDKVGKKVTAKVAKEAYYSGYAGRPVLYFKPGMVGVIAVVGSPPVCCVRGHHPSQCNCERILVDFGKQNEYGRYPERVDFYADEIELVDESKEVSIV